MRAETRNAPRRLTVFDVQAEINTNARRQAELLASAEIDPAIKREAGAQLKEQLAALYKKRDLLKART